MWLKALKLTITLSCITPTFAQSLDSLRKLIRDSNGYENLVLQIKYAKELAESNPDSALVLTESLINKCKVAQQDSLLGQAYIALSTSYSYLADYNNSTSNAFKAIGVAEQFKDTITLIDGFNNLGIDFMLQEDYSKSIEYFSEVNELSIQYGDSLRWGHALNNLGLTYGYMGEIEEELDFYDQAAVIFLAIGEKEGYANTLLNSGTVYTVLEQFAKATSLYEEALLVFEQIEMTSGIQNTLLSMAENLLAEGRNSEAEAKAQEALEIAKNNQFSQDQLYSLDLLSQIAEERKDFHAALSYHRSARDLSEELFTEEKSRQIVELETKYQTEKKEQELVLASLQLEQQQFEKYVLIGTLVFLLITGGLILFSVNQKSKLQRKLLGEEIENLRLKINSLLGDSNAIKLSLEELNEKLHQPLSEREFEILNLTVSDKTNQEIAEEVFVSVNTVKFHLKNVYEKLGVNNRKEALHLIVGRS
ncbi:tetratricopeptide repeat protein [Ekhidna sp.]|uniref:tetratricopeptide repeat protein n=1 Tax=Ekhidna sp. TaxID=2608089 RepID=UPI003C7DE997